MARSTDAGRSNHIQPDIALPAALGVAGMHSHARQNSHAFGPWMGYDCSLALHGCLNRIDGARKGDEEAIALRIDLATVMCLEDRAQQRTILGEHIAVAYAEPLEQLCRVLNVREQ